MQQHNKFDLVVIRWQLAVQANSSNAMSRSGVRQGLGRQQSSPSRIRSAPSQKGHFSLSGTLEEGTPPVELSTSPPGTGTFSRPAWLVPGQPRLALPPAYSIALWVPVTQLYCSAALSV